MFPIPALWNMVLSLRPFRCRPSCLPWRLRKYVAKLSLMFHGWLAQCRLRRSCMRTWHLQLLLEAIVEVGTEIVDTAGAIVENRQVASFRRIPLALRFCLPEYLPKVRITRTSQGSGHVKVRETSCCARNRESLTTWQSSRQEKCRRNLETTKFLCRQRAT